MTKIADSWNHNIKVSVIIPLYNVESLIEETIDGLLNQTLKEVEFILIDDGSSDDTYQLATNLTKDNHRFNIVQQENGGPAAARNHGLRLAKGEYICFVDADDLISNSALEVMYKAAIENNADLVTGGSVRFNSKGKWYIKAHVDKGLMEPGLKPISKHSELFYSVGPWGKLYKRELIEGIFFPEHIRFAEDQPFVLHAYLNAKRIFTVDQVIYYYRMREGEDKSLTQKIQENPIEILNYVLEMLNINDKNFKSDKVHAKLKASYYERVMTFELWPAVREAIQSKKSNIQNQAFDALLTWVKSLDDQLFNDVPAIRYFLVRGIIERFKFMKVLSFSKYLRLLELVISKFNKKTLDAFLDKHSVFYRVADKSIKQKNVLPIVIFSKKREIKKKFNYKRMEAIFLKRIVYNVSKMVPLKKKKIIFATNKAEELKGNLKEIYNEVFYRHRDWKRYVFLKEDRNFIEKCKHYWHLGNAKIILLDDYYNQLYHLKIRKGTEVIQTWHACGAFKKFGFSAQGYRDANSLYFEKGAHSIYTSVITSSSKIVPHYAEAFNKNEDQVIPVGVPRTDMFFDKDLISYTKKRYLNDYPQLNGKKVILYAPTFRGKPSERVKFELQLDLENMKKSLSDDYMLILKLHPAVEEGIEIPEHLSSFVINLSSVNDINELLLITDLLITDYSSVIFEYSLLNRPMIFFAYDLEYYLSERGFYYDYKEMVPGPIAATTNDIINFIKRNNFPQNKMKAFKNHFFGNQDGLSTERFAKTFLN